MEKVEIEWIDATSPKAAFEKECPNYHPVSCRLGIAAGEQRYKVLTKAATIYALEAETMEVGRVKAGS